LPAGILAALLLLVFPAVTAFAQETGTEAAAETAETPLSLEDCLRALNEASVRVQDLEVQVLRLQTRLRDALQWKLVRELEEEVGRTRGLQVKSHITMETLDRAETRELVDRLVRKDLPDEVALPIQRTLILLGALPPGTDLRHTLIDLFSEQVGGLYDDTTGKLYVAHQFDPESQIGKVILAHEICHALQDQNFDFSRYPLHVTDNDDRVYAATSAVEGDATILMANFATQNLSLSWLLELPKAMSIDQTKFNATPPYLQYLLLFPYLEGMNLMLTAEMNGPNARNAVLANPPLSTEQVIHPEKYLSTPRDNPLPVEAADLSGVLGPGWTARAQNTYGEEGIRAILMHNQPIRLSYLSMKPLAVDPQIVQAAEGWGGDRVAIWMKDGEPPAAMESGASVSQSQSKSDTDSKSGTTGETPAVVHWRIVWDTEQDAYEFRKYAVSTWLPAILAGAKPAAIPQMENASAWTADGELWARIQWTGTQVDILIGQGAGTEKMLRAPIPL